MNQFCPREMPGTEGQAGAPDAKPLAAA